VKEGRAVTQPDQSSGGKTLAIILLFMVLILGAIVAVAIWASSGA
jgi:hypothetical protein